ncbi:uncharacterized protein At1g01500 isoform X2 [Rhodamnia argentea]|uniref:Uncharacterized protein At1g01500 isoform X2 n=1 Tax=Rhodamnia argentea TaxID=178133 RepID=A0ABM3H1Z1_9MYRT|nr:uncharacterized protein At1g01500 isoform X2 [Rhodamnia argentea]
MEVCYGTPNGEAVDNNGLHLIRYSAYQPCTKLSLVWFDLRVFYVRISNFQVNDLTPELLTLNHTPLDPETLLEVNGTRSSIYSDGVSCLLRRDRIDKKSEEATFVSTDAIRLTGSVKIEVFDRDDRILSGVLEMCSSNGSTGESKVNRKRWSMKCQSEMAVGNGFLKGEHNMGLESRPPTIEVYVTGCFAGNPIILMNTLQISLRKKHTRKGMLDAIPEDETSVFHKDESPGLDLQVRCDNHNALCSQMLLISSSSSSSFLPLDFP